MSEDKFEDDIYDYVYRWLIREDLDDLQGFLLKHGETELSSKLFKISLSIGYLAGKTKALNDEINELKKELKSQ